jgi:hypothetical protein
MGDRAATFGSQLSFLANPPESLLADHFLNLPLGKKW